MRTNRNFLQHWFLNLFWYVGPSITLLIVGSSTEALQKLKDAAKPSKDRLHLQDVFTGGRRYSIEPRRFGFVIFTHSKHYWRYVEGLMSVRRHTRTGARLIGELNDMGMGYTRVHVRAHIRIGYLLDVLWIPAFISSIVVFMPWPVPVIAGIMLLLFMLSFAYHRYNAAYQANEMVFFVERALKDRLATNIPVLQASNTDVLRVNQDFEAEWERFYKNRQGND